MASSPWSSVVAYWRRQLSLTRSQRRSSEIQVLPSAPPQPGSDREWSFRETVVLRRSPRASSLVVWGGVGLTGALLIWAVVAPLPETIAVQGKLEPGSGVRDVQAPVPGVVEVVLVQEGQSVRKGQPLVRFDLRDARSKLSAAESVRERLIGENQVFLAILGEARVEGFTPQQLQRWRSQLIDSSSRREAAREELAASQARVIGLTSSVAAADQIARRYEQLSSSGAVSEVQALESRNRVTELRTQLQAEQRQVGRLRANLITASSSVAVDLRDRIDANLRQIADLDGQIRQARLQLSYSELKAPAAGVVFDLAVKPGSVVQPQMPTQSLLKIVPQDALEARVYLPNSAVGFVRQGQRAEVSLDAFNASDYGRIPAVVNRLGSDALTPETQAKELGTQVNGLFFPATLRLQRQTLTASRAQPLQAGMSLTADIYVRERRFIQIITGFFEDKRRGLERLR